MTQRENETNHIKDLTPLRLVASGIFVVMLGIIILAIATTFKGVLIGGVITLIYCIMGYFAVPDPDMDDLGWAGGLINNPFRISDNINRTLLFFRIALAPGKFLAETLVALHARYKVQKKVNH